MLIKRPQPGDSANIKPSEISSESIYLNRRLLLQAAIATGASGIGTSWGAEAPKSAQGGTPLKATRNPAYIAAEKPNKYEDITTYNNYYEFGTDKDAPARNSGKFKSQPWAVIVAGEAEVTGKFTLEDFLKPLPLEERIYRMRCVEAWSMVIPWVGIPLGGVLKRFKPTSKAKYVAFTTVMRPSEMPGQQVRVLDWPYVEALRLDEAMHPLALLATGIYGRTLLNQNGAPLRLVTPWKYGFKGVKSIVEISFLEKQPQTTWNVAAPEEYGFYANVNPKVDHPRWSQARERRIGGGLLESRIATQMFNGYAKEIGNLYKGMNLAKFY